LQDTSSFQLVAARAGSSTGFSVSSHFSQWDCSLGFWQRASGCHATLCEIARDVAKKLIEAQTGTHLPTAAESFDFPVIVAT
jgi:hypothetical protein